MLCCALYCILYYVKALLSIFFLESLKIGSPFFPQEKIMQHKTKTKTTHNIIDLTGVLKLCPSFDTIGPICKTVEDTNLLFNAMSNVKFRKLRKLKTENFKFLIIKNMFFEDIDSDINDSFNVAIEKSKKRQNEYPYIVMNWMFKIF